MKSQVKKTILPNGLTIVSESTPGFQSVSLGVWVKAGTRDERENEAGAAHFLEHMLFKGTSKRTALQIAEEVDEVGGEFNAFTAREHTCYHLLLLKKDLELGAEILSDVILNSAFDSDELERERGVILQEIAMVEESPEELVHDLFLEDVYGSSGLGRPILGTARSIRRMTRQSLTGFFERHYRPEQLVVAVVGDVSHARVVRAFRGLAKKNYPRRPGAKLIRAGEVPSSSESLSERSEGSRKWIRRPSEQVHLVWGVRAPHAFAADRFGTFVLANYLGGGMSSRLFQEIREKNGLAYTVYASFSPYVGTGLLTVYAATQPTKAKTCLDLIQRECARLTEKKVARKELERMKENVKGTLLLALDSVESRMMTLARSEAYFRRWIPMNETLREIDALTPEQFQVLGRKLFAQAQPVVTLLGPGSSAPAMRKMGAQLRSS